jgi:hypothetical protein
MTDAAPASRCAEEAARRLEDIAGHLTVAGLRTCLCQTRHTTYLTVVSRAASGKPEVEAVVDDDGYVELRFWPSPSATPTQIAAAITRATTAVIGQRPS